MFVGKRASQSAAKSYRLFYGALLLVGLLHLVGCGSGRAEAEKAAVELAEALYPAQLELYATHWQKAIMRLYLQSKAILPPVSGWRWIAIPPIAS